MSTTARQRRRPDAALRKEPFDARLIRKAEAIAARYHLVLWREGGEWFGRGLELPFCMGDGKTINACAKVTRRSMTLGVAALLAEGQSVPRPQAEFEERRKMG